MLAGSLRGHSESSLGIIISEVLRRLKALWQQPGNCWSVTAQSELGPLQELAGILWPHRNGRGAHMGVGHGRSHTILTGPRLIKEVGTSFFVHCENAWHLLLSFTPVLL